MFIKSPDIEKENLQIRIMRLVYLLLFVVLAALSIKFLALFKEICLCFAMALLLNYLFAKPVELLTRYVKLRFVSVLSIYVIFLSSFALAISYLIPRVIEQIKALKGAMPKIVANLDLFLVKAHDFLSHYQIDIPVEKINRVELLNQLLGLIPKIDYNLIGDLASTLLSNSVYVIVYFALTIILSIYLLVDGKRAWELFLAPFSKRIQFHLLYVKEKIDERLNAFLLGQFQVATLTASVMLVAYISLNVPYALILGLAQFLEIIPVLGTWLAIIPCLLIVAFTTSITKALITLIIYLAYSQIIRDNFVTPRIMGSKLGFHPIGIILALLLGAQLGGLLGVIIALPILAVITSVIDYNLELAELKVANLS